MEPPDDVQAAHWQLVHGLRLLSGDLGEIAQSARRGPLSQAADLLMTLHSEGARQAIDAAEQLERAGYRIGRPLPTGSSAEV